MRKQRFGKYRNQLHARKITCKTVPFCFDMIDRETQIKCNNYNEDIGFSWFKIGFPDICLSRFLIIRATDAKFWIVKGGVLTGKKMIDFKTICYVYCKNLPSFMRVKNRGLTLSLTNFSVNLPCFTACTVKKNTLLCPMCWVL